MEGFTWLLIGPGDFIVDLLFSPSFVEGEARADLGVTLGIVCWLVLLQCLRLAWPRLRPALKRAGHERGSVAHELTDRSVRGLRWFAAWWSWPEAWAVFWRAEVVHLGLYAMVPGWIETMRVILFVTFLPFTLMTFSPGEKRGFYEGTFTHLHQPVCWTFVSWCPSPSAKYFGVTQAEASACASSGKCPAAVRYEDRYGIVWKTVWAMFAGVWIVVWNERRLRRGVRAQGPPGRSPGPH